MAKLDQARTRLAEELLAALAPIAASRSLELVDVECTPDTIRVSFDDPRGSLDSGVLAELTPQVSEQLDNSPGVDAAYPGRYLLEVSTPGLERVLRTREHFARFGDSKVSVKLRPGVEGERRFSGRIGAASSETVAIELDSGETRVLKYDEIERARTIFEWPAQPKKSPGAKGGAKK